ncbi:glucan endo-1,3-beta-glucosidase 1-like [Brassica rapa]|uniref:glucan endo-1,3-beta-glucosidase 1-like n=1 Tax=Brassica campestris TaxID=3711 RepID=UPI0004F15A34|nr:glucan endo-1,3-beta-glucosidase 1-like [Brassica rapa]
MAIKNSFSLLLSSLMVFALIAIPTISGQPSGTTWCVANPKAQDPVVQAALGWACQQSETYCSRIQRGQNCYSPNTLRDHASVVFNTYYQHNKNQAGSCDFNSAAVITHTDPSHDTCQFESVPRSK